MHDDETILQHLLSGGAYVPQAELLDQYLRKHNYSTLVVNEPSIYQR